MNRRKIELSLNTIEDEINQGHYLDRMIVITREFGLTRNLNVLLAFKEMLIASCKPQGLDQFLWETSQSILYMFSKAKFPKKDMQQVVYCLEHDSLDGYLGRNLFIKLRQQAMSKHTNVRSDK